MCATNYLEIAVVITITIRCSENCIAALEFRTSGPASDGSLEQIMVESTAVFAI